MERVLAETTEHRGGDRLLKAWIATAEIRLHEHFTLDISLKSSQDQQPPRLREVEGGNGMSAVEKLAVQRAACNSRAFSTFTNQMSDLQAEKSLGVLTPTNNLAPRQGN